MAAQSARTPTLLLLAPLARPMTDGWSLPLCNFTFFEPDDAEAISADKPALRLSTGESWKLVPLRFYDDRRTRKSSGAQLVATPLTSSLQLSALKLATLRKNPHKRAKSRWLPSVWRPGLGFEGKWLRCVSAARSDGFRRRTGEADERLGGRILEATESF